MLCKKNILICLTAVTLYVVGVASASTVTYVGDFNDVRYDGKAQYLIDCYTSYEGDAWSLQWECSRVRGGDVCPDDMTWWKFIDQHGALLSEMKAGAVDILLKIDGIPGESTDEAHADWIEVMSFSHGVSKIATRERIGDYAATEGCYQQDFTIVKELDEAEIPPAVEERPVGEYIAPDQDPKYPAINENVEKLSPLLNLLCCTGAHIDMMTLELCRASGDKQPYMRYDFEDVIVSSISLGGGGGVPPTKRVTFNYSKISWVYIVTHPKTGEKTGEVKICWDLSADKGDS